MLGSIIFIAEDEILIYSFGRNHAADMLITHHTS